jgi:hypothetical protein
MTYLTHHAMIMVNTMVLVMGQKDILQLYKGCKFNHATYLAWIRFYGQYVAFHVANTW